MVQAEDTIKNNFFEKLQGNRSLEQPEHIARLREKSFNYFQEVGLPTTDEEDWKYTNVSQIGKISFEMGKADDVKDQHAIEPFLYDEARQSQLVFINGSYRQDLSSYESLPEKVVIKDIVEALADKELDSTLHTRFAKLANYRKNPFTALNTALFESGIFIFIPKGTQISVPVHLLFLSSSGDTPIASFPRVLIVAERDSSATIIENYSSLNSGSCLTNAVMEVYVGENAQLVHYKVQREDERSFHIAQTSVDMERYASYNSTAINVGAEISRHDIEVVLDHEGAECWLDGLYMTKDGQHTDTHSLISHISPHCKSHQLYKGILTGRSRAVFNGKVFVHAGAQQTDAFQTNKNLLLSNEARVDTKPQLEIFADDVKCAHGATVGQLEEEELFYLISRGLNQDTARNLLTYGFAEEVVEKIKVNSIKQQLDDLILNRLHARL